MPSETAPRLADAIAEVIADGLATSADHWLRAALPQDWPLKDAFTFVMERVGDLHVGLLRPHVLSAYGSVPFVLNDDPSMLTKWRDRARHTSSTVIVGDALGPEESGLRAAHIVVQESQVVETWSRGLVAWLRTEVHSETVLPVVQALVQLASRGDIDAVSLDRFFAEVLADPAQVIDRFRTDLWRVNLIPDRHILDVGVSRSRLALNLDTKRLLLTSADTVAEGKRLARLREAAARGDTRGEQARAALAYRESQDSDALSPCDLDVLREILAPRTPPRPPQTRPLDFFDFLDALSQCEASERVRAMQDLAEDWDLTAEDATELAATVTLLRDGARDVRVKVTPTQSAWVGDGSNEGQTVAVLAVEDGRHDWLPWPPTGECIAASRIVDAAVAQDSLLGFDQFAPLVRDFVVARSALAPYESWLRHSALPLFVLHESAREIARDYLRAWQALVDAADATAVESSELIRDALLRLEAIWGTGASGSTWCSLGPLHPYLLDPLLQVADYCASGIGNDDLGTKVAWALDRSLPAYRVLWTIDGVLFLAREDGIFEFSSDRLTNQPHARAGTGIYDTARSFVDYHPFAATSLSITLIDPPRGGAVTKNLQRLQREVTKLRVNVVVTRPEAAHLEQLGDDVHFLGRFASVQDWLQRAPVRSHLTFYFAPRQPASAAAATGQGWGPTPGAHVALKVSVRAQNVLASGSRMTPYVTFEPRNQNRVVIGLQRLSRVNEGTPRLFEIEPMLRDEQMREFASLRDLCDWAVLAAPSPLGLIPARDPGGDLVYVGRESLSLYGLFVYVTSLFPIRRLVTERLRRVPAGPPNTEQVEARLTSLALESSTGVLRMGQTGNALWEHVGLIVASEVAREIDS